MPLPAFDRDDLLNKLHKMDKKRQLAFGASCCQRLIPNYTAFNIDTKWGDANIIKEALDTIWSYLFGNNIAHDKISELISLCENNAPDSEDFSSFYVSFAQDACFAICSILDFMIDNNPSNIVRAATYATDSVDLYVQEIEDMDPNDTNLEQNILNHKFMQRELLKQNDDLVILSLTDEIDDRFLDRFRSSWDNNGMSNLDLP